MIYRPNDSAGFDCYVDASFAGDWKPETASETDSTSTKSRTGYVIRYAGCPILWASKLQTTISLSSTEAEVVALSSATREVIPLMRLGRELQRLGYPVLKDVPTIRCKIFEDNTGCIEIVKVPKMRPRTKHLSCSIFHFRHEVEAGNLRVEKCHTSQMAADQLTKSVDRVLLKRHRKEIQGWDDYRPGDNLSEEPVERECQNTDEVQT